MKTCVKWGSETEKTVGGEPLPFPPPPQWCGKRHHSVSVLYYAINNVVLQLMMQLPTGGDGVDDGKIKR